VVGVNAGLLGESGDQPAHRRGQLAEPLVVTGLFGQTGEGVPDADHVLAEHWAEACIAERHVDVTEQ
jgi:hypothetical protein